MSKYHSRKVVAHGIKFDSKRERDYYLFEILPQIQSGEIIDLTLQPLYVLQPAFTKNGKRYRAITYKADFWLKFKDGHEEIIDVKGFETPVFRLKQKLFEYKYKNLTIKVVK